jgi:hypothetical protein
MALSFDREVGPVDDKRTSRGSDWPTAGNGLA